MHHLLGNLFIVSAPSGTGKTSLVHELVKTVPDLSISVSHTTRPQRVGEINGTSYHFVDEAHFKAMIAAEELIEYARVYGNYYGTSKNWVTAQRQQGRDIILEIDWQGCKIIQEKIPEAISIFLLPPSATALKARLTGRERESLQEITTRLQQAQEEILHHQYYQYLVMNEDFQMALFDLQTIVRCQRLVTLHQKERYQEAIQSLLMM